MRLNDLATLERFSTLASMEGGIVLCGGKSTRMGTSKALLPFGDETMLQRVVRLLSEVVTRIVIVAAADQELPALPPHVTVTRDERDGRGPLEGLRAGLKALPDDVERAYVTSCDVPLLVPAFARQMLDLSRGYDVAVMQIEGFTHPLSAVYAQTTLAPIEGLLAQDRLRPAFLFDLVKTRRVRPDEITADPDLRTLRNLNTPEDYDRALEDIRT
jgi:molybdenum cofactor guanylyltransferase